MNVPVDDRGVAAEREAAALSGDVPAPLGGVEQVLRTRVPPPDERALLAARVVGTAVADESIGRVESLASRFASRPVTPAGSPCGRCRPR